MPWLGFLDEPGRGGVVVVLCHRTFVMVEAVAQMWVLSFPDILQRAFFSGSVVPVPAPSLSHACEMFCVNISTESSTCSLIRLWSNRSVIRSNLFTDSALVNLSTDSIRFFSDTVMSLNCSFVRLECSVSTNDAV